MLINSEDMSNLFRNRFKGTSRYKVLEKQFEQWEIDVYLENYGDLCCELNYGCPPRCFRAIEATLKHQLLIDRQLVLIHSIQEQINDLQEWFKDNPKDVLVPNHINVIEDKDVIRLRLLQQRELDNAHRHIDRAYGVYNTLRG